MEGRIIDPAGPSPIFLPYPVACPKPPVEYFRLPKAAVVDSSPKAQKAAAKASAGLVKQTGAGGGGGAAPAPAAKKAEPTPEPAEEKADADDGEVGLTDEDKKKIDDAIAEIPTMCKVQVMAGNTECAEEFIEEKKAEGLLPPEKYAAAEAYVEEKYMS